jgi:hypothetical protein
MKVRKTIEPVNMFGGGIEYGVFRHDTYPESSVLAGNPRRQVLLMSDDIMELREAHPDAEVLDHTTKVDIVLPEEPPDWFDPTDAGEEW